MLTCALRAAAVIVLTCESCAAARVVVAAGASAPGPAPPVAALLAVDAAGRDAAFPAAPVPWTPPPNHIVAESAEAFCWDAW